MAHNSQSPSQQKTDTGTQQPVEIIRKGYTVRVSDGQEVIVPTAFGAIDLPLTHMHKPDFSKAVNMDVGVSVDFIRVRVIYSIVVSS
jgi:hypothetical protein